MNSPAVDPSAFGPTTVDILLLPAIFAFLAWIVYGIANAKARQEGAMPKFRYLGFAIMVVALLSSLRTLWDLINPSTGPFYRQNLMGNRVVIAHYASPVLMLLLLAGMYALDTTTRKSFETVY